MESIALREIRDHGDAMFPLCVYHISLTPGANQQTVSHHWHEEVEFVLVTRGSVDIQVGTSLYRVHEGQGVLISQEEIHAMTAPGEKPSECYAIVFHLNIVSSPQYDRIQHRYIQPMLEKQCHFPTLIKRESDWETAILTYLQDIIEAHENQFRAYEMIIKSLLYLIFSKLVANNQLLLVSTVDSLQHSNISRLKTALTYIESHFSEKIKLPDLAAQVNMSEGHFCRFFKQMTYKTPVEYINDYRMNQATRLLLESDRCITDIAMDIGFDNVSYFIKVFRTSKRCTPSRYRKLMANMNG